MKRITFFLLFILGWFTIVSAQQVAPDSIRKARWSDLQQTVGSMWHLRWDTKTGLPASLFGGKIPQPSGKPLMLASSFLKKHHLLFGVDESLKALQHYSTQRLDGVTHVTFMQMYQGIPVDGGEYRVHFTAENQIVMVNGRYYPNIRCDTQPKIEQSRALDVVQSDLGTEVVLGKTRRFRLVVYPQSGHFKLAWKMKIATDNPPGYWLYYVDALTGKVLQKQSLLFDADPGMQSPRSIARGYVYPTHPSNSTLAEKVLPRLAQNGYLQGTYAYILNDDGSEAYSGTNIFEYSPTNTHFDEVNLYYHIDRYRSLYISNLGFTGFTQMTAHAHTPFQDLNGDGYIDPNAWFNPNDGELYFNHEYPSWGIFDFAKEDKVVYHEYTHAVVHSINDGIYSSDDEEGAISEGTADYFAGSFTNRSVILEYSVPSVQRDMTNPAISSYTEYTRSEKEAHDGGEFWSATLWDLRNNGQIGQTVADNIIYGALGYLTDNPSFQSNREAIISQDLLEYNGQHVNTIQDIFANRGIGEPSPQPLTVSITGPTHLNILEQGTFTANPSGGSGVYTNYTWWERNDAGIISPALPPGVWFALPEFDGESSIQINRSDDFSLKVKATDSEGHIAYDVHSIVVGGLGKKALSNSERDLPSKYAVTGNYPNPFNPSTTIQYQLPNASQVNLVLYNVRGQLTKQLVHTTQLGGYYQIKWDGTTTSGQQASSGTYLYRITAKSLNDEQDFQQTGKMLLLR